MTGMAGMQIHLSAQTYIYKAPVNGVYCGRRL